MDSSTSCVLSVSSLTGEKSRRTTTTPTYGNEQQHEGKSAMDIVIETSDPENVIASEIAKALESQGFFVFSVEIQGRADGSVDTWNFPGSIPNRST